MSFVKTIIRFPCGYEITNIMDSGIFSSIDGDFDSSDLPVCPIHGKKCKRGKKCQ